MTMKDLELYCENTYSSILYLQLEALGCKKFNADLVCSHIGKAIGLTTIIRSIPSQINQNKISLPVELMKKVNDNHQIQ